MKPVTPVLKFMINLRQIIVVILSQPGIVILSRDKITTVVILSRYTGKHNTKHSINSPSHCRPTVQQQVR